MKMCFIAVTVHPRKTKAILPEKWANKAHDLVFARASRRRHRRNEMQTAIAEEAYAMTTIELQDLGKVRLPDWRRLSAKKGEKLT